MSVSRKNLHKWLYETNILDEIPCTVEENQQFTLLQEQGQPLPEGVFKYEEQYNKKYFEYYKIISDDLSEQEITWLIMIKQTKYLESIKYCLIFFVVLGVISIAIALLGGR